MNAPSNTLTVSRRSVVSLLAWGVPLACWGVILHATFRYPAFPLDEGTLVAYPARLLQGYVPHRDFVTFYGPANVWILSGAFKVFGASLDVERTIGLSFRLLGLAAAVAIGARFGRAPAIAAAVLAALVWLPWTVQANAALTAIALALLAIALLSRVDEHRRRGAVALAVAGALPGLAVLVRFDFLPAVALAVAPPLVAVRRSRRAFLAGLLPMLALGLAHLLLIGPDAVERVLRDIVASDPERDVPVPNLSSEAGKLFGASVLAAVAATAIGLLGMRRDRDPRAALLAGLGLLVAGLLPYMSGRADLLHITTGGAVACVAIVCVVGHAAAHITANQVLRGTAVAIAALGLSTTVTSVGAARRLLEYRLSGNGGIASVDVHVGGRSFRLSPNAAYPLQPVLDALVADARPGQRLYVGPHDLRFAEYNDPYLYFLLPQLRPASIYWEDNPGTVNGPRYDLAAHLLRADFLVLNRADDPTGSDHPTPGSSRPNEIVDATSVPCW